MKMFMKAAAITATLGLATAASAAGMFGYQTTVSDDNSITIDLVNAAADGELVVYDYTGGEFGDVLGTAPLTSGANTEIVVTLSNNIAQDLAAVIYEGAMTEPTQASDFIVLEVVND